jgi:tetratricopeptide (TPR) repeat protein
MLRGWLLATMGYREEPATELARALRIAKEQDDLETVGWTHGTYVWLARFSGDTDAALAHATQAYEIGERIGDAFSRAWALFWLGTAHLVLGDGGEAIVAFEGSLALSREARTGLEGEAVRLAALAEALLAAGEHERALGVAREAVAIALERGNDATLPWAYRVLAESVLAGSGDDKVAAAKDALERATAAVEASGARGELQFIERVRAKLVPLI